MVARKAKKNKNLSSNKSTFLTRLLRKIMMDVHLHHHLEYRPYNRIQPIKLVVFKDPMDYRQIVIIAIRVLDISIAIRYK